MTEPATVPFDRAMSDALAAFVPPALPADFADHVLNAALQEDVAHVLLPVRPASLRRGSRRRWALMRRPVIGLVALGMMSATAAAAGLFGDVGMTVPALKSAVDQMVAVAVPPVAPKPSRAVTRVASAPAGNAIDAPNVSAPVVAVPAGPALSQPGERRAQQIADRIERRIAERARLGLPVPAMLRDPMARPSDDFRQRHPERAAMIERIQTLRQERRAKQGDTGQPGPSAARGQAVSPSLVPPSLAPLPLDPSGEPAKEMVEKPVSEPPVAPRLQLTPAQRARLRQWRQQRRERQAMSRP